MMMSATSSTSPHRSAEHRARWAHRSFAGALTGLLLAACGSHPPSETGASNPAPAAAAPAAAAPAAAAPAAAAPATPAHEFSPARDWPVPPQWRSETIPFPLEFAPELSHRGAEELRFAPGMFQSDAPDYWSYAFVWWLEDRQPQDASTIAAELTTYFRGLLTAVAKDRSTSAKPGRKIPATVDPAAITCTLRSDGERDGWQRGLGTATVQDSFGDGRKLILRLTVAQRDFPTLGRRAILVLASPAAPDQPIWKQLEAVAASFAPSAQ